MACSVPALKDDTIQVWNMRDGELAVITEWADGSSLIGSVIQRVEDDGFIVIGEHSGHCCNRSSDLTAPNLRVRLLKPGDVIRVDAIRAK